MSNTIIYITDAEGKQHPAEVRSVIPESSLVTIMRDYATARLVTIIFNWDASTSSWRSAEGFLSDFEVESAPREEVSIRIP
jgi:hypothetical protein